jgi:hypothetical protein
MSSGGSSSGHDSGSRVASACADASVAEEEEEEVNQLSVSVLERILACWLVLDVGKSHLFTDGVDKEKTRSFREKAYGDTGDCACSAAALNELLGAAQVCSAEALFGGSANHFFPSPALFSCTYVDPPRARFWRGCVGTRHRYVHRH